MKLLASLVYAQISDDYLQTASRPHRWQTILFKVNSTTYERLKLCTIVFKPWTLGIRENGFCGYLFGMDVVVDDTLQDGVHIFDTYATSQYQHGHHEQSVVEKIGQSL